MCHFADLRSAGLVFFCDLRLRIQFFGELSQIRRYPIFLFANIGLHALIQICTKNNFTEEACGRILVLSWNDLEGTELFKEVFHPPCLLVKNLRIAMSQLKHQRNLQFVICELAHLRNLRICDSNTTPKICGLSKIVCMATFAILYLSQNCNEKCKLSVLLIYTRTMISQGGITVRVYTKYYI